MAFMCKYTKILIHYIELIDFFLSKKRVPVVRGYLLFIDVV